VRALEERIHRQVAGLGDETMLAVVPALADVRRELAREVAIWLQRNPQADSAPWTLAKYVSLLLQVRTALDAARDLEPALLAGLKTTGRTAGEMSVRQLEDQVALYSRIHGQPVLLDLSTASVLAEGRSLLIPRFESSAEKYSADMQLGIRRQLAVGFLKGESWGQMAHRLAQLGSDQPPPGHGPADIARGLWRMGVNSAMRIARTEGMTALNAHQQIGLEHWARAEPGAMKRWDASQDMACPRCRALHNIAIAVAAYFLDGVLHPTLHPFCKCCVKPHHIDWS